MQNSLDFSQATICIAVKTNLKSFFEAKSSIKNDKLLSKCFTETMNRNLSTVSMGSKDYINNAYAKGKIPLYKDLGKYICENCTSIFD